MRVHIVASRVWELGEVEMEPGGLLLRIPAGRRGSDHTGFHLPSGVSQHEFNISHPSGGNPDHLMGWHNKSTPSTAMDVGFTPPPAIRYLIVFPRRFLCGMQLSNCSFIGFTSPISAFHPPTASQN